MVTTGKRLALNDATERLQAYKAGQALLSALGQADTSPA